MKHHMITSGMGCPHCIKRVEKAMAGIGAEVESMALNDFTVSFDGEPDVIRQAIEALGFHVVSIEAL